MEAQIPDRQLQQGWTATSQGLARQDNSATQHQPLNLATAHISKARIADAAASKLSPRHSGGRLPPQRPTLLDTRWQRGRLTQQLLPTLTWPQHPWLLSSGLTAWEVRSKRHNNV